MVNAFEANWKVCTRSQPMFWYANCLPIFQSSQSSGGGSTQDEKSTGASETQTKPDPTESKRYHPLSKALAAGGGGEGGICTVYPASKNGLNAPTYAPGIRRNVPRGGRNPTMLLSQRRLRIHVADIFVQCFVAQLVRMSACASPSQ